jgi:uncharacterized protein
MKLENRMNIKTILVPTHLQMLGALDGLLAKAEADPRGDALLAARLADDMHPLATQIRYLCNMPGEALARLTGLEFVSSEHDPATLAEARSRIAATRAELEAWSARRFVADEQTVALELPNGMAFDLTAAEYVRDWALPQYYFHVMAAYSILRAAGLAIGKADYAGYMMRYLRSPAPA